MTSVSARRVGQPPTGDTHARVSLWAGPDSEHRAHLGTVTCTPDEGDALVARLADPDVDPHDLIRWQDDEADRVSVYDHMTQESTGFPTWWTDTDALEVALQLERQALAYRVAVRMRAERAAAVAP